MSREGYYLIGRGWIYNPEGRPEGWYVHRDGGVEVWCKDEDAAYAKQKQWEAAATGTDMVNAPPHYNVHGFEVADILESYFSDNPHLWNCGKYLLRSGYKGHEQQDIEKMIWYGKRYLKFKYGVNFDTDTIPELSTVEGDS